MKFYISCTKDLFCLRSHGPVVHGPVVEYRKVKKYHYVSAELNTKPTIIIMKSESNKY